MDTTRLRYFTTVVEAGSIRSAAEILHISPAALSKAIKLLEDEVGVPLLLASGRGIRITDQGSVLADRARRVLQDLNHLASEFRQSPSEEEPLRLASFEVFTTHFLGPLVEHHLQGAPPLLLYELVPGHIEEAVKKKQADLGVTYIPIPSTELDHLRVATIEMGIYGLRKFKSMPFSELPFAIPVHPVEGSPTKVNGLDGWPENKIQRFVQYRVAMLESALELCRRGLAVGYFPQFVVNLQNQTVRSEYRLELLDYPRGLGNRKQEVFLVKRKSDVETIYAKKLAKAIRVVCKERQGLH